LDDLLAEREKESSGTPTESLQDGEMVLVVNKIPLTEVELSETAAIAGEHQRVILKDRYVILQHLAGYEQFHQARSEAMKKPTDADSGRDLPPLLGNPERTFPIHFHDDLAGVYISKLQSAKFLYSPGIDQLNDLYEVIAHV